MRSEILAADISIRCDERGNNVISRINKGRVVCRGGAERTPRRRLFNATPPPPPPSKFEKSEGRRRKKEEERKFAAIQVGIGWELVSRNHLCSAHSLHIVGLPLTIYSWMVYIVSGRQAVRAGWAFCAGRAVLGK